MLKNVRRTDICFFLVILVGLILFSGCIFAFPLADETFYFTVPFRFMNGDSMILHEWHLTQFSSIFQYLLTVFFVKIKGSTEGLIVFFRFIYIILHTFAAALVYRFFRKFGAISVVSAAFFYIPMGMFTINYHNIYLTSLVLLSVFLYLAFENKKKIFFVLVGLFYGFCCVCNPSFVIVFLFYSVFAVFAFIKRKIHETKCEKSPESDSLIAESHFLFFNRTSVVFIVLGISVVACCCIFYFLSTGGNFSQLLYNLKIILSNSEYAVSAREKTFEILQGYNKACLYLPFLPPLLILSLLADRKKYSNHKYFYLFITVVFCSAMVIHNIVIILHENSIENLKNLAVFFPVVLFSGICYMLTRNKNRVLFLSFWIPGLIGSLFALLSSRSVLFVFGWTLVSCAVSGLVFIRDLFYELKAENDKIYKRANNKIKKWVNANKISYAMVCIFVCGNLFVQCLACIQFNCFFIEKNSVYFYEDNVLIEEGPLTGTFANEEKHKEYSNTLNDLDYIKQKSKKDEHILILSYETWCYLYIDRPMATCSAWAETCSLNTLKKYYEINPEKKPKYIYIDDDSYTIKKEMAIKRMFDCKKTYLSEGILLTVRN